ncbi:MAG TPA: response regulator transcription factor [Cyclobacteriaceae bacterium]|nr:response regulator transcription factor [Cyclobacteriaceae bacterium]
MKILVIEDERILAEGISHHLTKEGFICEVVFSYNAATEKIHLYGYDCIIVDINLPDGIGFDLIEALKGARSTAGIIVISARDTLEDRIKSLDLGSDDYLTKPFHLSELNARVKSIMRRRNFGGVNEIDFEEIKINFNSRKVFVHSTEVMLSRKEYDLLMYFIANKDITLTKASMAEHLWGDNIDAVDSFDILYSHVKNLRKKLTEKGANDYIYSVYGIGYKFGKS